MVLGWLLAGTAGSAVAGGPAGFPGTGTGAIPDGNPAGLTISFAVSGIVRPVGSVQVSIDLTHTWVGDVQATLISPGGKARLVVFGRVGTGKASTFGDSSNLGGLYWFYDGAVGDLWAAAALIDTNAAVPPGSYRTLSSGAPQKSNLGGCPTSLNGVFSGLQDSDANGTWTLVVSDAVSSDAGTVNAATLYVGMVNDGVFMDGFETFIARGPEGTVITPQPRCWNKPLADFTGDGLTDFTILHPNAGTVEWTILPNLGAGTAGAALPMLTLGTSASVFDSFDIDGDRIADPAAWTAGDWAIRPSSRGFAEVWFRTHGQTNDDVMQSADYDGDSIDDTALVRAPPFGSPPGPVELRVQSSMLGWEFPVSIGTGVTSALFAVGGFDYSGDGKPDVAVQRAGAGSVGDFTIYDGRNGSTLSAFTLGTSSDFIIPGNHTGSYYADVTVSRAVSGNRVWETRDSETGVVQPPVTFSIVGDQRLGGDYDGDGLTDHAVWHPSTTPGASQFQIRPSTNTAVVWNLAAGISGDYAVAGARVH
ncbi:MAG: proprotein convertase P-domain-containing protein [Xanthomonadales bacterium]|nr:proprotein convertase P-domain-containing protein [Xanthomonadales bacterium]